MAFLVKLATGEQTWFIFFTSYLNTFYSLRDLRGSKGSGGWPRSNCCCCFFFFSNALTSRFTPWSWNFQWLFIHYARFRRLSRVRSTFLPEKRVRGSSVAHSSFSTLSWEPQISCRSGQKSTVFVIFQLSFFPQFSKLSNSSKSRMWSRICSFNKHSALISV